MGNTTEFYLIGQGLVSRLDKEKASACARFRCLNLTTPGVYQPMEGGKIKEENTRKVTTTST